MVTKCKTMLCNIEKHLLNLIATSVVQLFGCPDGGGDGGARYSLMSCMCGGAAAIRTVVVLCAIVDS